MGFSAPAAPVLLGEAEQTGGAASLTVQPPPSTGALQVITPSGTTQLVVTGATSGAKYFSGPPGAGGLTSVPINQAADAGYAVASEGPDGTVMVTTYPSSGVSSAPGSSPFVGEAPPSIATVQFTATAVSAIQLALGSVPAGAPLFLVGWQWGANNPTNISDTFSTNYSWDLLWLYEFTVSGYVARCEGWAGFGGAGASGLVNYGVGSATSYFQGFACAIPAFGASSSSDLIVVGGLSQSWTESEIPPVTPSQSVGRNGSFGVAMAAVMSNDSPIRAEVQDVNTGGSPAYVKPSGYNAVGNDTVNDAGVLLVPSLPAGADFDPSFGPMLPAGAAWYGCSASVVFPA